MIAAGNNETKNPERTRKRLDPAAGLIFKKRRHRTGSNNDAPATNTPTPLPNASIKWSSGRDVTERSASSSRQKRHPKIRTYRSLALIPAGVDGSDAVAVDGAFGVSGGVEDFMAFRTTRIITSDRTRINSAATRKNSACSQVSRIRSVIGATLVGGVLQPVRIPTVVPGG